MKLLHTCQSCSYSADLCATRPSDDPPRPSDIHICGNCGAVETIVQILPNSSVVTRPMSDVELAILPPDVQADISFAVRNIKAIKIKNASQS